MIPDRNRVVYFGSMSRAALLVVAALVSLAGSARVRADAPPPLEVAIERYFAGEQAQGYAWLAAGDASLVAGGTLQFFQSMLLNQAFGAYLAALVQDRGWSKTALSGAAALKSRSSAAVAESSCAARSPSCRATA